MFAFVCLCRQNHRHLFGIELTTETLISQLAISSRVKSANLGSLALSGMRGGMDGRYHIRDCKVAFPAPHRLERGRPVQINREIGDEFRW